MLGGIGACWERLGHAGRNKGILGDNGRDWDAQTNWEILGGTGGTGTGWERRVTEMLRATGRDWEILGETGACWEKLRHAGRQREGPGCSDKLGDTGRTQRNRDAPDRENGGGGGRKRKRKLTALPPSSTH